MEKLANRSWPPVGDLTWLGTHLQAVPNGQSKSDWLFSDEQRERERERERRKSVISMK